MINNSEEYHFILQVIHRMWPLRVYSLLRHIGHVKKVNTNVTYQGG